MAQRLASFYEFKSNLELLKLTLNHQRDKKQRQKLKRLGWQVLVVWECKTTLTNLIPLAEKIRVFLK
jgi:G:T-mismatch repair DNA endonuclease (very short patch repair protein)